MFFRLYLLMGLMLAFAEARSEETSRALLVAHRGGVVDATRIENSLPAVEEAVRRGYAMLEVDLRESADGRVVAHHDEDLQRYFGDSRRVEDLTWDEVRKLRSTPGGLHPPEFAEYCRACRGRVRLMLDTKGPEHDDAFFEEARRALGENSLLESAFVIGTDQSKEYFGRWAKVGVDRTQLLAAIDDGEPVDERYFLFEHGDMPEEAVRLAQRHGVEVVPSINVFHYPAGEHERRAEADILRLWGWGVRWFQIDSVYEPYCRTAEGR
jgi:hypothetical protein